MVDGSFLTGKYQGYLLMAVTTDANNQLFSLAFALVEREKNETWRWFFQCLHAVIGTREGLCVISDWHAGILHAMRDHRFGWSEPNSYHRYCMRYFQANFNSKCSDKILVPMLAKLIWAHNKYKFDKIFNEMTKLNAKAMKWFEDKNRKKWAISYDEGGRRWGIPTSNNAETMNSVFLGMRKLPVTAIVMEIFYKLNSYFVRYREQAVNREMNRLMWSDFVMKKMEKRSRKAGTHKVRPYNCDRGIYEVITGSRCTSVGFRTCISAAENKNFVQKTLSEDPCVSVKSKK